MAKLLDYSTSFDGSTTQVIGIKAGYLGQGETSSRAHVHVQPAMTGRERTNVMAYKNTPYPAGMTPYIVTKSVVEDTATTPKSKHTSAMDISIGDVIKRTVSKPVPAKVVSLSDQLNSNHFGSSDFRFPCLLCNLPSSQCHHNGVHQLPLPICPSVGISTVAEVCRMICYACSRFTSTTMTRALETRISKEAKIRCNSQLNGFGGLSEHVSSHGQFKGGKDVTEYQAMMARRWSTFTDKGLRTQIFKTFAKQAKARNLSAHECPHCGMIQPERITESKDRTIYAQWSISQVVVSSGETGIPSQPPSSRVWEPTQKFWHYMIQCIISSAASSRSAEISQALATEMTRLGAWTWKPTSNDNSSKGDEDELLERWTMLAEKFEIASSKIIGIESLGGADFVLSTLGNIFLKAPQHLTEQERWICTVWPFVSKDKEVLRNTLQKPFLVATAERMLSGMRDCDVEMIGKSSSPNDHIKNIILHCIHIPEKAIRPTVHKTSGGGVAANSTITDSIATIIKYSAKLRGLLTKLTPQILSSWSQLAKVNVDTLVDVCKSSYGTRAIEFDQFRDDARLSFLPPPPEVYEFLSNLSYEMSSTIDHKLVKSSLPKAHNSALTGAKNARSVARQENKARVANSNISEGGAQKKRRGAGNSPSSASSSAKKAGAVKKTSSPSAAKKNKQSSMEEDDDDEEAEDDVSQPTQTTVPKKRTRVSAQPSSRECQDQPEDQQDNVEIGEFLSVPISINTTTIFTRNMMAHILPCPSCLSMKSRHFASDKTGRDLKTFFSTHQHRSQCCNAWTCSDVIISSSPKDGCAPDSTMDSINKQYQGAQGVSLELSTSFSHQLWHLICGFACQIWTKDGFIVVGDNGQLVSDTHKRFEARLCKSKDNPIVQTVVFVSSNGIVSYPTMDIPKIASKKTLTTAQSKKLVQQPSPQQPPPDVVVISQHDFYAAQNPLFVDDNVITHACIVPSSPEQLDSLNYAAGNNNAQQWSQKTMESRVGGKKGLVRYNGLTKRDNFSIRVVLGSDANMAVNCSGIPVRVCLSQTKPVIVTDDNIDLLEEMVAKSMLWTQHQLYPDLGGAELIINHNGSVITVFNWHLAADYLFDDAIFVDNTKAKERILKAAILSGEMDSLKIKLHVGWTVNCFLAAGDQILISRPPILQRGNHNAHYVIPIPGYAMRLNVCCMKGYNADSDGDALIGVVMQSMSARASIKHLMALENNMICPRAHHILSALVLDALIGTCLLISEGTIFDRSTGSRLLSCFRELSPRRLEATSTSNKCLSICEPRAMFGMMWNCTEKRNDSSYAAAAARGREENGVQDARCTSSNWSLPDPSPVSGGWSGVDIFQLLLPSDFSYYKALKGCNATRFEILSFIAEVDKVFASFGSDGQTLSRFSNICHLRRLFPKPPNHLVVIRFGRWICGTPSSETLSTSSDSIPESLWRNYGKFIAADWLSDISRLAQYFLSDIRGLTCSFEDIILGGRDDFCKSLVTLSIEGDRPAKVDSEQEQTQTTESDIVQKEPSDDTTSLPPADARRKEKPYASSFVMPRHFRNCHSVTKLRFIRNLEFKRSFYFSYIDKAFEKVNNHILRHAGDLRKDHVSEAYEMLEGYTAGMILFGANMLASHNKWNVNNVTLMARTGTKGNSVNSSTMSATVGIARVRNSVAVGSNISPSSRNLPDEMVGERTSSSLGFIPRGYAQGLTGKQFFHTSKEARVRTIDSGSPERSGYVQTQVGVSTQAVSVHYDGTVRNQLDEIIQVKYAGDGYDAVKVKRVMIKGADISCIPKVSHQGTRNQLIQMTSIVVGNLAERPSNEYASAEKLMADGFWITSNVDLNTVFLIHSQSWKPSETSAASDNPRFDDELCEAFDDFCHSIYANDVSGSLMPTDVLLFVRLHTLPEILPQAAFATIAQWKMLFVDIFSSYVQNMVDPGEAVGPLACQSANQPTTQLIMKSFKIDVAGVKEKMHISSGLDRLIDIWTDAESKATVVSICLDPNIVKTEADARFAASTMRGTLLSEWVEEDVSSVTCINMMPKHGFEDETSVESLPERDYVEQIRSAIVGAYGDAIDQSSSNKNMPSDFGSAETSSSSTKNAKAEEKGEEIKRPRIENHAICLWRLKPSIMECLGVVEYATSFVEKSKSSEDDIGPSNLEVMEACAFYIDSCWQSCLMPDQIGGLVLDISDREPYDGETAEDFQSDLISTSQWFLWMAFRHSTSNMADLGMLCSDYKSVLSIYNNTGSGTTTSSKKKVSVGQSPSNGDEHGIEATTASWSKTLSHLVGELPGKLVILGDVSVGNVIKVTSPCSEMSVIATAGVNGSPNAKSSPTHDMCWKVSLKGSQLSSIQAHPLVVDIYTYTSNLGELFLRYGVDSTSHFIALEASRVLAADGDVYVQTRHLQLLADVMTSEGSILAMNQGGLAERSRSSFVSQVTFEQISDNLIKSAHNGRYDMMSHVVPNVLMGKRAPFIGSGICHVISPLSRGRSMGESAAHSAAPAVLDQNMNHVDMDASQYRNIIDILVGVGFKRR